MVVDEANVVNVEPLPPENQPPLVVDPDAVETGEVAAERLESVAGWGAKVAERASCVQKVELPERDANNIGRKPRLRGPAVVKRACRPVSERSNLPADSSPEHYELHETGAIRRD
jgi:hypothetical protein